MMHSQTAQTLTRPAPVAAALAFPLRARGDRTRTGPGLRRAAPAVRRARLALFFLALGLAAALVAAFWNGIDRASTPAWVLGPALVLFALNALWLATGAALALIGLVAKAPAAGRGPAPPPGRTAILWLICGEPPGPVAARIAAMSRDLDRAGLSRECAIFVLSDTQPPAARRAEARSLAPLIARGAVRYRNRSRNLGHKPGNIADWLRRHGAAFETMLVLDADSALSVDRLQAMRREMAADPALGLVQSGIRLRPGSSRFAALQRLSGRLCGSAFLRVFAAVAGEAGNYWGHNALIRVRAFAASAGLPALPGRAPLGGAIRSHDIVEAAWLVRSGWAVRVLPGAVGSFEAGPETLAAFHRRDRRWCQGNLQHVRLIGASALHPLSRLHLLLGVQHYLASPIWLGLVLLFATGLLQPAPGAGLALLAVAAVLMLPKAAALQHWRRRVGARRSRRALYRALGSELVRSSLVAPLVMVRQTLAVAQVLAGQDCGWQPGGAARATGQGRLEMSVGATLLGLTFAAGGGGLAIVVLMPVAGPLLAAPWLIRWLDRAPAASARAPLVGAAAPAVPVG